MPADLDLFRIDHNEKFFLKDHDPAWLGKEFEDLDKDDIKPKAQAFIAEHLKQLTKAQEALWASNTHSVLVIVQAMDAAGKDTVIKHVTSGLNPQGCEVHSFKQPSTEELDHTFLWRAMKVLPSRGTITLFNRSYYEDVLVVKVHPEWLDKANLPAGDRGKEFWQARYDDINALERHLTRNGTMVLKFFLNVSKKEQRKRFLERLEEPGKLWKFSPGDVAERAHWDEYMDAYQSAIRATSTEWAPWYVVPADHKWVTRAVVSDILTTRILDLDLKLPKLSAKDAALVEQARQSLMSE